MKVKNLNLKRFVVKDESGESNETIDPLFPLVAIGDSFSTHFALDN